MRVIKSLAVISFMMMLLLFLSGCVDNCTEELSWYVSPSKKTISIDEGFKINGHGTTCGGKQKVHLDWSFKSEDTSIATVNNEGYVTGKNTGNTRIAVSVGKGTVGASWVDITVK